MRLAQRLRLPEIMDDPGLDPREHAKALRGLARLNLLSRSVSATWQQLKQMIPATESCSLTLLDLATGGGDLPISLAKTAKAWGVDLQVAGCDISPVAVEFAQQSAFQQNVNARFFIHDALHDSFHEEFDFVTANLFFHHLSDHEAITLLRKMRSIARKGILINDLSRAYGWYGLVWLGSRIVTTSYVVHVDGPRSIASAYTPREFASIARRAGLEGGKVHIRWPARFLFTWTHS